MRLDYNRSMKLSFRGWLTIITLVLLSIVVFFAWPEIVQAWELMKTVNLWILLLLIPVQFMSYYATGGMIFSYLRSKGELKDMSHWSMTRLALELNFVNHMLPSGGAAGFSYLAWILKHHKVSVARTTMSQIIRFILTFLTFTLLLIFAMIYLIFSHKLDTAAIWIGIAMGVGAIGITVLGVWLMQNKKRLERFGSWITRTINGFIRWITRGKKQTTVDKKTIPHFFVGLHDDYLAIRNDRKILIRPFLWALFANVLDASLIWISFWALGFQLDPALLFIAFGVASIAGAVSAIPGGAGVYETVMITFLAASGVTAKMAIAGTLLARVTLLMGTILFGYIFYQLTIIKYGKLPNHR